MDRTKPMRVVALLNEAAGTIICGDGRTFRETLADTFTRHGIEAELHFLHGNELKAGAERALHKARKRELDAVVVGGGDGSISTVAAVLAGTDVPLGVLPLGTLNHFAKDLNIPLAVEGAVQTVAEAHVRTIDLGEVNGNIFVNNSSIGVYPYLVADRERLRKQHGLAKWPAMAMALWHTLRLFPIRRLFVCAGGVPQPYRSPCVFVGNNEYKLSVPVVGRRERLDGGELCLYVAKPQGRFALFWMACRSILGLISQRDLVMMNVPNAEISSHHRRLLVARDGEVAMMRPPLRYRIRPRALRVFAPAKI